MVENLKNSLCMNTEFPLTTQLPDYVLSSIEINELSLAFKNKFIIYSIISLGFISVLDLSGEFLHSLQELDQDQIFNAFSVIINSQRGLALRTIPNFVEYFYQMYEENNKYPTFIPEGYEIINKIMITPTTYYVILGEPDASNRLTRKIEIDKDDLLRVSFVDENLNKFLPYPPDLQRRVQAILSNFNFAGKLFEVIGFSASQLKEHSA